MDNDGGKMTTIINKCVVTWFYDSADINILEINMINVLS